jgi:hypothetical protein
MSTTTDKVITMRRWSWVPESKIEVTLREAMGTDTWTVIYEGNEIGIVHSYEGSLDTPLGKGSRIVRRGKRRKLWASRKAGTGERLDYEHTSRADAIRRMLPR